MNLDYARKISQFVQFLEFDKRGKPKVVVVPGHESKRYQVILWRDHNLDHIDTECTLITSTGNIPCPSGKHICYHAIGAVLATIEYSGFNARVCKTHEDACRLSHIYKGIVVSLAVRYQSPVAWLVVYNKKKRGNNE